MDEVREIRASDRREQGVTPQDEAEAENAVRARQVLADGRLTLLQLPDNQTSAAVDRMEPALGGPGYENLLILSPGEINFFGAGDLARALDRAFRGGWLGVISRNAVSGALSHCT